MALHYPTLVQSALRQVVRGVLEDVTVNGLEEPHQLYITYRTQAPGVHLPQALAQQYPEEITIVIEHQFWDLRVDEKTFSVTLKFGGQAQQLEVPFAAITQFADPGAEFALNFGILGPEAQPDPEEGEATAEGPLAEVIPWDRGSTPV